MSDDRRRRPRGPDAGPQPVAPSIARVLGRIGASPATSPSSVTMELVFTRWDEVAGADFAGHLHPMRLQGTVLVVGVDHPAWATRARMESERILDRIRQLGDTTIERIEVVVQRPSGG